MARHFKDQDGHVHFEGVVADYVLCGLAPEGGDMRGSMVETHSGVDCEDCIRVVHHCHRIRHAEIKSPFERRRA